MATEDAGTLGRLQSVALLYRERGEGGGEEREGGGGGGGSMEKVMENILSLSTACVLRFKSQKYDTAQCLPCQRD